MLVLFFVIRDDSAPGPEDSGQVDSIELETTEVVSALDLPTSRFDCYSPNYLCQLSVTRTADYLQISFKVVNFCITGSCLSMNLAS